MVSQWKNLPAIAFKFDSRRSGWARRVEDVADHRDLSLTRANRECISVWPADLAQRGRR